MSSTSLVNISLQNNKLQGYPLKLAEAWQGNDACNKWHFVTCDPSQNIVKLNLSKQGFSGTISPAIANLTSLTELYLNDNNLTGTIPPPANVLTFGNMNIGHYTGNYTASPSNKTSVKTVKILLAVLGPAISIIAFWIIVYGYKKRRHIAKQKEDAEQWGSFSNLALDSPLRFTYSSLKTATNDFDLHRKLGGGGFGTVFEGNLIDGTKIAVKRLDRFGQGKKEFLAEVQTIGSIHHVNLVKLVGFCAERVDRLLVDQSYVMTQMRGTRGYLAPEWLGKKITERADVYSYGVVLLEVIFERKNLDCYHPEESTLIMQVKKMAEENQLLDLLCTNNNDMHQNFDEIEKTVRLAIWCLHTEPARRPSMSMAIKVLEGAVIPEAAGNCSLTSPTVSGSVTPVAITEISDFVLSGPR
ncbi:Receptor-like kinase TMK3 [Bienertia sinuspersici]